MVSLKEVFLCSEQFGLEEDKFQDAAKKYPKLITHIQYFKSQGILPKYLPWAIKMLLSWQAEDRETSSRMENVHELVRWLKSFDLLSKKGKIKEKDINKYKSPEELAQVIEQGEEGAEITPGAAKKQATKIYEDSKYLIIQPKSEAASCLYGKGTRWCIAAKSENYWETYTIEEGYSFLFIIDKQKPRDKTAIAYMDRTPDTIMDIYDAGDTNVNPEYIAEHYPQHIIDVLNKYFNAQDDDLIFEKFNLSEFLENPEKGILVGDGFQFLEIATPEKFLQAAERINYESLREPDKPRILQWLYHAINDLRLLQLDYRSDVHDGLYRLIKTEVEPNLGKFNAQIMSDLLQLIVADRLGIATLSRLISPFISNPVFMKKLVKASSTEEGFFQYVYENMIKPSITQNLFPDYVRAYKQYINELWRFKQVLWHIAESFGANNYNFENMPLRSTEESVTQESVNNLIDSILENVLDKMGKQKISKSIRKGFVGGGVYTEFPSSREKKIIQKVSKNLHRRPYSHRPPMMGISTTKS